MVLLRRTPVGDDGTPPHCAPDARRSVDGGRQRLPTPVSLAQPREWLAPAMGVHGSPRNGSERHERHEMGQNAVRVCAWAGQQYLSLVELAQQPIPRRLLRPGQSRASAALGMRSSIALEYCCLRSRSVLSTRAWSRVREVDPIVSFHSVNGMPGMPGAPRGGSPILSLYI